MPTITDWLMVAITLIYVVATILICIFNGKSAKRAQEQIKEMKAQQKQNAGIGLYSMRRDVLERFSKNEYNGVYWDSVLLFSDTVSNGILETGRLYEEYKAKKWLIEEYESRLKESLPEQFDEYQLLCQQTAEHPEDDSLQQKLYDLCDSFQPVYDGPIPHDQELIVYSEVSEEMHNLYMTHDAKHLAVYMLMKDEIKKSINLGE